MGRGLNHCVALICSATRVSSAIVKYASNTVGPTPNPGVRAMEGASLNRLSRLTAYFGGRTPARGFRMPFTLGFPLTLAFSFSVGITQGSEQALDLHKVFERRLGVNRRHVQRTVVASIGTDGRGRSPA